MTLPSTHLLIQTIILGLLVGGVYALMASGLTLIFGVMRVINVAHGAFLIAGAYGTYWLFQLAGIDPILSIALTAPVLFGLGWAVQRFVLSRMENPEQSSVLVTFALAITLEGVMGTLWKTTFRTVKPEYAGEVLKIVDIACRSRAWRGSARPFSFLSCYIFCCSTPIWGGPSGRRFKIAARRSWWG
jgi:branched-subunit amino acid ABC-type transport system permease component